MPHDPRILKHEDQIETIRAGLPDWVRRLERPVTPSLIPRFGPLEGIRVVSTGVFVAQPFAGTKFAEFGAEVIHVERPGGDTFRFIAPLLTRGPREHGCDVAEVGKNKLSLGLDLKQPGAMDVLMALWKISDVWMECSAPGTLERAGITSELALAINPSLVILKVSTYGQYGKESYLGRAGYDAIAQAFGGMINVTGDPSGPPQRAKIYTGDYITALTGWAATMMALWEVKKTGRGQIVDLAQYEAVAQTMGHCMPLYTGQGTVYGHTGNKPPFFQPYDTFKCSDGWVYIGALGGPMWDRLSAFLGFDTKEFNFETCSRDAAAVSSEKGKAFDQRMREFCAARTALEVEDAFNSVQVGCSRIFNMRDQYEDEHYNLREMSVPVVDQESGMPIRVYGVVPKLSLTPGKIWRGAPSVGGDTDDILATLLGRSEAEIARLYENKAVHRTEPYEAAQVEALHP